MGYYSEVSLTIRNSDFCLLVEKSHSKNAYEFLKEAEIFQTKKYTTLYWNWVKWYMHLPEIQLVEDFMQDKPHYFHRLGEDDSDYEYSENIGVYGDEDYEMSDCACIIRNIDISGAGEQISLPEIEA